MQIIYNIQITQYILLHPILHSSPNPSKFQYIEFSKKQNKTNKPKNKNNRTRGPGAFMICLHGRLLDKRISVRYKLTGSSTNKITENLSQK